MWWEREKMLVQHPCGIVKNEISLVERLLLCIFYTKKKKKGLFYYLLPKIITVILEWYTRSVNEIIGQKGKNLGLR